MKTGLKNMTEGLPSWAKGVIAVAVVAGVGFVLFKVYKRIKGEKEDRQRIKDVNQEIENAIKKGQKKSFPDSTYQSRANQIYEGMKYGIGDDYASVRNILMTMKNDLDVLSLNKAFGKRQAYVFGIPQGEPKDLFTFVRAELGNEYGGVSSAKMDAVNKDWQKKGIKYQF